MPTMEELKQQYADEWLAVEVTKAEKSTPLEGVLLDHDREQDALLDRVKLSKEKDIAIFFAGPPLKEGYAAIL